MVDQSNSDFKVAADNRVSSQPHAQRETVMCSGGSGIIKPATGASPSNTAPSNYTEVQILHQGVDSLYLNYAGSLTESADTQLEHLKVLAQSPDAIDQSEACFSIADHVFCVKPRGRGRFPYLLTNNWYQIQLSRISAEKMPLAYVQVSSELLSHSGVVRSVDALTNMISVLAGKVIHPTVSRADLCVDFVSDFDWESVPQHHWISRAARFANYYDKSHFSGCTFGQGGAMSCRLYDKTLEIQKSEKVFFHSIWKENGWDGESPVWRLEFQLQREVLNECLIRSVNDLLINIDAIWAYCTKQWLQLKQPQADDNTTRWPLYSIWGFLQQVHFEQKDACPVLRVRKDTSPSDRSLFVNGLGAITSFMAREGLQSIDEALDQYLDQAQTYHRKHSQQTGKTLTTYVREKVEQKRTRFAARSHDE